MRQPLLLFIYLWIFIFPFTLFGQDSLKLTLESSLEYAFKQNPEYRIARTELDKAEKSIREAYSSILPQLNGSASFQHAWKIQESTIPNFIKTMMGPAAPPGLPDFVKISFALENTFTYGATVNQPLFLGGAGIAGIQAAIAAKRASQQNLEANKQNLIYQTANAFYACLLAKELITVQEEALNQARANLDVVIKKYDVGSASGYDRMRAQVDVANLQPPLIAAKNNYQSALTQLRTIIGLNQEAEIQVVGQFAYTEDNLDSMGLQDLQDRAFRSRPEILALLQQKTISRKGIDIARSEFLPKLYFSTDYSFLANKENLRISQSDFSRGFTSSLNLQIPLFHGFRSTSQYQKAKLDYKIVLDTEKQARDGVAAEVEFAYNKFNESKEKYQSAKETVQLAQESLRLANLMYEEGTNTQLDVLNSQLALTQARMNYVSSLYEYQVARYQLRKATGILEGILS
ncbi:MAG: TolC family protein [Calditrichia bacterium]